jgi:methionyl-tRNA formyltransferase
MRLAFLGTPEAAVAPLRALVGAGHDVDLVVTRADKKRGRGGGLSSSPVKAAAIGLGLEVVHDPDALLSRRLDLGVVVAFGRIIKPHVLAHVPMVNVHFSLLPRWRGAAPVERAILAGDTETGVCLMEVAEGLDEGGVYAVERVTIGADETADELRARLVDIGSALLVQRLADGLGRPTPQHGVPTYAAKIEPEDRRIDWSQPAEVVLRRVRIGRAWTTVRGQRLLVHRARRDGPTADAPGTVVRDGPEVRVACGGGWSVTLLEVQPEGKARMGAVGWLNGARLHPAEERLGSSSPPGEQ